MPAAPEQHGDLPNMSSRTSKTVSGAVAFVAVGPGDPELITLRAAALLGSAEVVVADEAALAIARELLPAEVEVLAPVDEAGKALSAAGRGKLIVDAAKSARAVVRLLGGDPVLDGTLAAEASAVAKAGLTFEIAPGVSPALASPVYAGLTLTSSDTRSVAIIDAAASKVDWASVADAHTSVVVLHAHSRVAAVGRALLEAGRAPETPVMVLRHGTTVEHEATVTTLGDLGSNARATVSVSEDSIMVVSSTVSQREVLSWFEHRPLLGWRVLLPRTRDEVGPVAETLRRLGAVTIEVPTISVEPPRTPQQMERAVHGMVSGRFEWVAFTSPHAVRAVREKLAEYGLDARSLAGMKVAAIGQECIDALLDMGIRPDLVPEQEATTAALLDEWPEFSRHEDPINRVFIPRADIATEALAEGLTAIGWEVEEVTAYRTVRAAPPAAHIRDAIKSGGYDAVLFTSASTVRNLVGIAGKPHASTVVACIGPATASTAGEHGLRVDVLAPTPDVPSLITALAEHALAAKEEAQDPMWRPSRRKAGARRKVT